MRIPTGKTRNEQKNVSGREGRRAVEVGRFRQRRILKKVREQGKGDFFMEGNNNSKMKEYWGKNLGYMVVLLSIWFVVSYGFGILLVEPLNAIRLGGFPLGFWFAQQGAIYVFVALIFIYCALMRKLDKEYDVHE